VEEGAEVTVTSAAAGAGKVKNSEVLETSEFCVAVTGASPNGGKQAERMREKTRTKIIFRGMVTPCGRR
jgi:hypothetical protein